MACLLAVFVPQNCPPSETFDKEVPRPPVSRAAAPHAAIAVLAPLRSAGELDRARPVQHVRFCRRCFHPALTLPLSSPCSFVIVLNFITCFAGYVLYYAEYQRETFLIEFLDANPAERHALAPCGLCDD